jgi:RimJ/RimL family protein N-acetyltransferase
MFTGKKVRLRAYRREDLPLALEYINDSEVKRNLAIGVPLPLKPEEEEKWYESLSVSKPETFSFAIETLEDSRYIGGCGFNRIDWKNRHAMVGIFIGEEQYRGRGYGTDAMRVLLKFAFNEMNLNKVRLEVFEFNARAVKSYQKCGFVTEGVLRQELFREGAYHGVVAMGILRDEWLKTGPKKEAG